MSATPSCDSLSTTTTSREMSPTCSNTVSRHGRIQWASLVETVMIARSCTPGSSAELAVDECRQGREGLEDVGGDVLAVDLDRELLLERQHELEDRHRVQLRHRAEQRGVGVERRGPVLQA